MPYATARYYCHHCDQSFDMTLEVASFEEWPPDQKCVCGETSKRTLLNWTKDMEQEEKT